MSFERKNLAYVVRNTCDKQGEMVHILQSVEGSAIVYARSRKRTKEMAELLSKKGISATFYHAGLAPDEKDERQKAWQAGPSKGDVRHQCLRNGNRQTRCEDGDSHRLSPTHLKPTSRRLDVPEEMGRNPMQYCFLTEATSRNSRNE